MKRIIFILFVLVVLACLYSCGYKKQFSAKNTSDTQAAIEPPLPPPPPPHHYEKNIVINKPETPAKGYAMVYCPAKMITNIPSVIDAEISKDELAVAYQNFTNKILGENPGKNAEAVSKDIRGDSINIYETMKVAIEFDADDFKQISKDDMQWQSFSGKNSLEWDWIVKPLHSTQRSIIRFKFYCLHPDTKEEDIILQKTINISVQVDARSLAEKWGDFLVNDPKTTITAILIPIITFFGGFFTAKKKKA